MKALICLAVFVSPVMGFSQHTIRQPQTIIFPAIPGRSACDTAFSLDAAAISGLTITYKSSNNNIATVTDGKVYIKKAGNVTITALQTGNAEYSPATPVARTFTIAGYVTPLVTVTGVPSVGGEFHDGFTAAGYLFNIATDVDVVVPGGFKNIISFDNEPDTSPIISIPFNFYFAGKYYAAFSVNRNGLLRLGSVPLLSNDLPGNTATTFIPTTIMAWANSFSLGSNGNVRYKVTGAKGDRRLAIEWNVNKGSTGKFDRTFQALLYEKDYKIKFVFGNGPANETQPYGKMGIVAKSNDYEIYNPSFDGVTSTDATGLVAWPALGTGFAFSVPGNRQVCPGEAIKFTADTINTGGAAVFQWYKNNIAVGDNNINYSPAGNINRYDSVWCVVTPNSCAANPTVTSNVIRIIVAKTTPQVVITATPGVCAGNAISFAAAVNKAGVEPAYQWFKNKTTVGTNSPAYANDNLSNMDSVWCKVTTNEASCATNTFAISNRIIILDTPSAPAAIEGPTLVTANQAGIVYSVNPVSGINYKWAAPAAMIVAGQGTNHVSVNWGDTGGNIAVAASNACGSSVKTVLHVNVAAGLAAKEIQPDTEIVDKGIQLFPNPAKDVTVMKFVSKSNCKYLLNITDVAGRIVFAREGLAVTGENRLIIRSDKLTPGLYFIRLIAKGQNDKSIKLAVNK